MNHWYYPPYNYYPPYYPPVKAQEYEVTPYTVNDYFKVDTSIKHQVKVQEQKEIKVSTELDEVEKPKLKEKKKKNEDIEEENYQRELIWVKFMNYFSN